MLSGVNTLEGIEFTSTRLRELETRSKSAAAADVAGPPPLMESGTLTADAGCGWYMRYFSKFPGNIFPLLRSGTSSASVLPRSTAGRPRGRGLF